MLSTTLCEDKHSHCEGMLAPLSDCGSAISLNMKNVDKIFQRRNSFIQQTAGIRAIQIDDSSCAKTAITNDFVNDYVAMHCAQTTCGCPKRNCLRQADIGLFDFSKSVAMILRCRRSVQKLNAEEKYAHVMNLVVAGIKGNLEIQCRNGQVKSRLEFYFNLSVDDGIASNTISVCRTGFCRAYGVSKWLIDQMSQRLKKGENYFGREFSDQVLGVKNVEEAEKLAIRHGIEPSLTMHQRQCVAMKISPQSFHMFT